MLRTGKVQLRDEIGLANVNFFTTTSSTAFTQCIPEATELRKKSLYLATPLAFNPRPTEGFPWDDIRKIFGRPFVKRFACAIRPLSVDCPVCDIGVLWPNGWMDQDETWHAGRPQPWPHCVRWEPSSPP